MSFDMTNIPTKADFVAANPVPTPPPEPSADEIYANRKAQIQSRLDRFFTNGAGSHEFTARVGFLTDDDKNALKTALEGKGYTVTITDSLLTVSV